MSAAHTAEHLFAGSLREIQPDIAILKVDQSDERNSLYVSAKRLDWETILKAEERANRAISEGRSVREHLFPSLEDARQRFPGLRAMEERISGEVRVVEIDGYDYAACARGHVENTAECDFFLVTRVVKAGKESFQIDFSVGDEAKMKALNLAKIALSVADTLGAPLGTVEKAISNMVDELAELRSRLTSVSERATEDIPVSERGGVKVYSKVFEGLDTKRLMKRAGELMQGENTVVLLANLSGDATVIFARSTDMRFDAGALLRTVLGRHGGQGGGRPEFSSGRIGRLRIDVVFQELLDGVFSD